MARRDKDLETARSAEDVAMAFRILDMMKTARDETSR